MKTCFKWIAAAILLGMAVSCSTPKKLSYLLDMEYDKAYEAFPAPELIIQPGDMLRILVSSEDALLAAPFNGISPTEGVEASKSSKSSSSSSSAPVYTVNPGGVIQFPVLGSFPVAGKTTGQIEEEIGKRIAFMGYIKEPVVNVQLSNFSVTVIGSAGNRIIESAGPSLNLLQVIAQTSGASDRTKIDDVMVIRTENGQRMAYQVNLQKTELFESPVFFLRQNDVVYIKPRGTTLSVEGSTVMAFTSTLLSLVGIFTNYLLWSNR